MITLRRRTKAVGPRRYRRCPGLANGDGDGGPAAKARFLWPYRQHLALVVVTQFRRRRVILRRRLSPVARLGMQLAEEPGRIAGVGLRIECRLQVGEGIRVVHQVDLCTADVDRPHSSRLHVAHCRQRLRLGVIETALSLGVHRPRPGVPVAGHGIAAAALDPADGCQEVRRNASRPFSRRDRGAA